VVVRRFLRQSVAALAVLGVLGLALLPREHVHVLQAAEGHHSDLIHRHFEPHRPDVDARGHTAGALPGVDHPDEDAQYLSSPFIGPDPAPQIAPAQLPVAAHSSVPRLPPLLGWLPRLPHASAHGPPPWARPHGLRAPPTPLV